jgi:hypothetical protein
MFGQDFDLDMSQSMHVEIKVFNSYENLHDTAKYTTCSMATYDYCYFQDDDWLNLYMDSMYTNFMRYPDLIHSNTMPIIHLEHKRWQFTNTGKHHCYWTFSMSISINSFYRNKYALGLHLARLWFVCPSLEDPKFPCTTRFSGTW